MSEDKYAIVDGANVAHIGIGEEDKPRVSNIVAVSQALEAKGYTPIVIVDASLYHHIDDPQQLEGLLNKQGIQQAPAGTDADYFVLTTADELDALVVSNDQFNRYRDDFPWIAQRRLPLMIVNGEVQLYEPQLE